MKAPLYIHIPYCLRKCGYCDFFSRPAREVPAEYVKAVARQIKFLAREFSVEEWKSVYIGGGSPSLLDAAQIKFLGTAVKEAAPLSESCEWTIEMNPESMARESLLAASECGINRLSLGVQCKNDKVLQAIGRGAKERDIESAVGLAKNVWRGSWSADLIAGLPFQTKEDLERDINFLAQSGAGHVSLYSLTLEEGTPLKKAVDARALPYDEEAAESLWLFGRDALEKAGFFQYEVSNFAKSGFESKHNAAYWAQESYLGAGAGATGTIYANPEGFRWTNALDAAAYEKFWNGDASDAGGPEAGGQDRPPANKEASQNQDCRAAQGFPPFPCQCERLDMATQEFEFIMLGLRTKRGASEREYKARYGGDLAARLGFCEKASQGQKTRGENRTQGQKAGAAQWLEKIGRGGETFYAMTREGLLFLNRFLEEL